MLLDNVQDTVFRLRLRPEPAVDYVSPSCEQLTGYTPEEWRADPALALRLVHPDDRHVVEAAFRGEPGSPGPIRWRHRDGSLRWVETRRRVEMDDEGEPVAVEGVARDVTDRVRAEEEARRARALFEATFMQAPVGMGLISLDPEDADRLVEVNDALCRMLGRSPEELLSQSLDAFTHPDDRGRTRPLKEQVLRGELPSFRIEKRYLRGDGTVLHGALHGSLIRDADGRPLYGLGHLEDVSARIAHEHQLRYWSLHDPLTDLPNRQLFVDRLAHALAQRPDGGRVAVLLADVDDLKAINDAHGHAAGDAVIVELGRRLCQAVRPGDSVARFAGDEFTILCAGLPDEHALHALAARLTAALEPLVDLGRERIRVAASFGAALTTPGACSPDELLAEADAALLQAKREGRGGLHVFDDALRTRVSHRRAREIEIRDAAAHGRFELHYQPIVRLADLRVLTVEALVRWRHPVHGLLGPATFVPAAERLDVIDRIGRWVLERACRDHGEWGAQDGRAPRISVNVSAREIGSERLLADVAAVLEATGCDPHALCFEITESAIVEDPAMALRNLHGLRALGATVALDDFGTGFSSLGQLAMLPVDVVKLDRSFIAAIEPGARRSAALVAAVCAMAGGLDVGLVAEGVETEAQRRTLLELGCDVGQGYLLGRPAPLGDVRAALHRDAAGLYAAPA